MAGTGQAGMDRNSLPKHNIPHAKILINSRDSEFFPFGFYDN